jgi:hypothetical protein
MKKMEEMMRQLLEKQNNAQPAPKKDEGKS